MQFKAKKLLRKNRREVWENKLKLWTMKNGPKQKGLDELSNCTYYGISVDKNTIQFYCENKCGLYCSVTSTTQNIMQHVYKRGQNLNSFKTPEMS